MANLQQEPIRPSWLLRSQSQDCRQRCLTLGLRRILPAEVSYSGLAPDYVGLYQLNIQVPQGAPVGDQFVTIAMPDVVSGSNITSNAALIPVEVTTTAGTSVAISPASISLAPGATQQFAATVNGGAGKVTWSVSAGTIDSDGNFTAP